MRTPILDVRDLRDRFPAPKSDKAPLDLKGSLGASFEHVAAMTGLDFGDENRFVFTLPLSPFGPNVEKHWRVRHGVNKRYHECFEALGFKRALPAVPEAPWNKATATATCYTRGKNDGDNLQGRLKVSLDCIVRAGYLLDDGPDHLSWGAPPLQIVDRTKPAFVVVVVTRELDALLGVTQTL